MTIEPERRRIAIVVFLLALVCTLPSSAFAVNGNFFQYSVRHEKGMSPFLPYLPVEGETVNSANGNLFFTVPLVSQPGRNGLGVDLKLAYNSKIWELSVNGGQGFATMAETDSWVGLGWMLRIARVIDDSANGHFYVTLSDGSNHDLVWYGSAWRSKDSTYMIYDPATYKLTLKGGVNLRFNYVDPLDFSIRHATRVQDTNGNYIDISYSGGGGRISSIQDTLGNTYTFTLQNNHLRQIQYTGTDGSTHSVFLYYLQPVTPAFGSGYTTDPNLPAQYELSSVNYPNYLEYYFTYQTTGEIAQVTYPTCLKSRYFYSTKSVYDRLLGYTVSDHYVTSHDTGTGTQTWTWTGSPGSGQAAPSMVSITVPDGPRVYHYMQRSSPGWADGIVTKIVEGNSWTKETRQDWTQDDESLTSIRNPRVAWQEKVINSMVQRTTYSYAAATDYSGNVKQIN